MYLYITADLLRQVKRKEVFFLICRGSLYFVDVTEGVLIFQLLIEASGPEIQSTDRFLLALGFVHFSDFQVVLDIVLTFLVREDLEVAQLSDLLHFPFVDFAFALFFFF